MSVIEHWRLDFDGRNPIYEQIVNQLCRSLVKKEILPGDRIPSIRDMAMLLKVNTNTIQRAYQEMERRQMIYSQRGTGYFVMKDEHLVKNIKQDMVSASLAQFVEEMQALGFSGGQIVTEVEDFIKKGGDDNGTVNS